MVEVYPLSCVSSSKKLKLSSPSVYYYTVACKLSVSDGGLKQVAR